MNAERFMRVMLSWCLMVTAIPGVELALAATAQVDPRAEVAAALYAASATQAASERAADVKLRAKQKEIESLRAQLQAGTAPHQAKLTKLEEQYVAELAARDRAYAQEIAVFRKAVEDIAATPEGVTALARFNAGDEVGALAVLDDLRVARDAARKKRADIESAMEGRRIARLALEARSKGKQTTAQVIARYEEVTRLDPGVHWDWIELGRLYQDGGNLPAAFRAAQAAVKTATDDRDRSVAHTAVGDVLWTQGDLPGALTAYRKGLALVETLATRDPDNIRLQGDVGTSHDRIGDVLVGQGDLKEAHSAYRKSFDIARTLTKRDPENTEWQHGLWVSNLKLGHFLASQREYLEALIMYRHSHVAANTLVALNPENTQWQRDLAISHNKIGEMLLARGDRSAALKSYRASHAIFEALAARDPSNNEWQRDLAINHNKIGEMLMAQGDQAAALTAYSASLTIRETLAKRDPGNNEWQRDLIVSYVKLSEATNDKTYVKKALDIAQTMQNRGTLQPRDAWMVDDLKRRSGQ